MSKNILILSVVYYNFDIVKKHVDFLTTVSDKADIIILENPSNETNKIRNYCLDLINKSLIKQYYLFEENICGGVFKEAYKNIDLTNYDYIMITDGDLTVDNNDNWLDEQINILDKYPDTFTCAVDLSLENLPVKEYPGCEGWHSKPLKTFNDCYEGRTGVHLLLFKKEILQQFMYYVYENNSIFVDGTFHIFCDQNQLVWRRTKISKSYHHTWDLYTDFKHPYTIMKKASAINDLWNKNNPSNYRVYHATLSKFD